MREIKSIVYNTKNNNWFGADFNMNIYRGCNHGCIYCDSRSDCYKNKNFDTIVFKENALEKIRDDLKRKIKKGVVATGAMSDPYNTLEEKLLLTRNSLQLISAFGFGVFVTTKSNLVSRDIDLFLEIKKNNPVIIGLTITTFDDELCKKIERNVSVSSKRFEAIYKISRENIFTGILLMPLLPFINDTEENIIKIVNKAYESGAKFIFPSFGVTLRDNQKEYFYNQLDSHFVGLKEKYINTYKNNYYCTSKNSKQLYEIFKNQCEKYGILYNMRDIIKAYKCGYGFDQLSLF